MMEPEFAPGRWDLPGGGIHPGEPLVEAASRECWEETGRHFTAATPTTVHFLAEERLYLETTTEPGASPFRHSVLLALSGIASWDADATWRRPTAETRRVAWLDPQTLARSSVYCHHWTALRLAGLVRH